MSDYITVYTTFKNMGQAERICRGLLEQELAACVNYLPEIKSFYKWNGKVEHALEIPAFIKTKKKLYKKVEAEIRKLHSFENPCIVAWEIKAASKPFLAWIKENTK